VSILQTSKSHRGKKGWSINALLIQRDPQVQINTGGPLAGEQEQEKKQSLIERCKTLSSERSKRKKERGGTKKDPRWGKPYEG